MAKAAAIDGAGGVIRRVAGALAAVLLCSACAHAVSAPKPERISPTPPVRPVRIMPLGDSITDGFNVLGGYRTDLWQLFRADGVPVEFVGSQYAGPPALGDRDHEGHTGWEIGRLGRHVTRWLRTYRPDIVLLHIGTNDILHGRARTAPARLAVLLDRIAAAAPAAEVYVATIIPLRSPPLDALVRRYDRAVSRIVRSRAAAGARVRLVDMRSAVTRNDLSADGIHPEGGGYAKIAFRWYAALRSMPMTRVEAEDPVDATVNDGERLRTTTASGGGKVGYLDDADSFLRFQVGVPAAGRWRLYVRAGNGTRTPCAQWLTVDGRPSGLLRYPSYGWNQWTITAADVRLNAGPNTLRLGHDTCGVEIDSIDVAPERSPAFPPDG